MLEGQHRPLSLALGLAARPSTQGSSLSLANDVTSRQSSLHKSRPTWRGSARSLIWQNDKYFNFGFKYERNLSQAISLMPSLEIDRCSLMRPKHVGCKDDERWANSNYNATPLRRLVTIFFYFATHISLSFLSLCLFWLIELLHGSCSVGLAGWAGLACLFF